MIPRNPFFKLGAIALGILFVLEGLAVPAFRAFSTHLPLFLPALIIVLGMAGLIGRGFGLQNIFHEDPELARLYRAEHGLGIYRNSPAIFAQLGVVGSLVYVWGFAYALGIGPARGTGEIPPDVMAGLPATAQQVAAGTGLAGNMREILLGIVLCGLLSLFAGAFRIERSAVGRLQPGEPLRSALGAALGIGYAGLTLWLAVLIEGAMIAAWGRPTAWGALALALPAVLTTAALLAYPKLLPAVALSALTVGILLLYALVSVLPEGWQPWVIAGLVAWIALANGVIDWLRFGEARLKFVIPGIVDTAGESLYGIGRRIDLARFYPESAEHRDVAHFRAEQRAQTDKAQVSQTDPRAAWQAKPGRVAPLVALTGWSARRGPRVTTPPERIGAEAASVAPAEALAEAIRRGREQAGAIVASAPPPASDGAPDAEARDRRQKLVLIATSGGAYRASFWTGIVLDALGRLERAGVLPGFTANVRLVTGASGGMVGGAYFAAMAEEAGGPVGSICERLESDILAAQDANGPNAGRYPHPTRFPIPRDSLSAVAQRLVQGDIPSLLWPRVYPTDRGTVLEDQWLTLDRSFAEMRDGEAEGWRPSLILSPMLAETGQPLLISNLDMDLVRRDAYGETVQFFDWFEHAQGSFRLKTAVRLNAAFPYVAPAAALPTVPYRRVVDAGYYDNYGVDLAATYLARPEIRDWVLENTSGVIVIQLRAFPFTLPLTEQAGPVGRALQFLTTPAEAMLAARGSTMTFRNRQSLRQVRLDYRDRAFPWERRRSLAPATGPGFVETVSLEVDSQTSLNWYLPGAEFEEMRATFTQPEMQRTVCDLVEAWWR